MPAAGAGLATTGGVRVFAAIVAVLAAVAEVTLAGYLAVICFPLMMADGNGLDGGVATIVMFGPVPGLATLAALHLFAVAAARKGWIGGHLGMALCLVASTALAVEILPWAVPVLLLATASAMVSWLSVRRLSVTGR